MIKFLKLRSLTKHSICGIVLFFAGCNNIEIQANFTKSELDELKMENESNSDFNRDRFNLIDYYLSENGLPENVDPVNNPNEMDAKSKMNNAIRQVSIEDIEYLCCNKFPAFETVGCEFVFDIIEKSKESSNRKTLEELEFLESLLNINKLESAEKVKNFFDRSVFSSEYKEVRYCHETEFFTKEFLKEIDEMDPTVLDAYLLLLKKDKSLQEKKYSTNILDFVKKIDANTFVRLAERFANQELGLNLGLDKLHSLLSNCIPIEEEIENDDWNRLDIISYLLDLENFNFNKLTNCGFLSEVEDYLIYSDEEIKKEKIMRGIMREIKWGPVDFTKEILNLIDLSPDVNIMNTLSLRKIKNLSREDSLMGLNAAEFLINLTIDDIVKRHAYEYEEDDDDENEYEDPTPSKKRKI